MNIEYMPYERVCPYIRYVNYYAPTWSYTEIPRVLFDYEFMYILNGHCKMTYNNVDYFLQKNDFFFLEPGVINQISVDGKAGFQTHCIHFDWTPPEAEHDFSVEEIYIHPAKDKAYYRTISNLSRRPLMFPQNIILPQHVKNVPARLQELFSRCYYAYLKNNTLSRIQLKADFLTILALLIAHCESTAERHETTMPPSIMQAVAYIQLNYHKPLSVAGLAAYCHLSEKYFGYLFKENLGKSMNRFLLETRISAAMKLLTDTNHSIEEIAFKIGFDSVYYFSNSFKKVTGISPSTYRQVYSTKRLPL